MGTPTEELDDEPHFTQQQLNEQYEGYFRQNNDDVYNLQIKVTALEDKKTGRLDAQQDALKGIEARVTTIEAKAAQPLPQTDTTFLTGCVWIQFVFIAMLAFAFWQKKTPQGGS